MKRFHCAVALSMIAIDTNVLLRYLLADDAAQSAKAAELIKGDEVVLVTDVVLVETIWTLKGKRYGLNKDAIISVIHALFEEPAITFESPQTVWRALNDYRNARSIKSGGKTKEADFPDALFVNKARYLCGESMQEFNGAFSFDVAAQQLPGVKGL